MAKTIETRYREWRKMRPDLTAGTAEAFYWSTRDVETI